MKNQYLSTMLTDGKMYRYHVAKVSKEDAKIAYLKCYDSIAAKFDDIAYNREDYKTGKKDDTYNFLYRYKEIVSIQLKRHQMDGELGALEILFYQFEGLLKSLSY